MSVINWFPGHMAQAKRNLKKAMASIDVVVEVLDARMPLASSNPLFEELRRERQRPALRVLNKVDLADDDRTEQWFQFLSKVDSTTRAVKVSAKSRSDMKAIITGARELAPHRGDAKKPLRIIMTGVPNVGKSTLLNGLVGSAKAQAADEPAVTRMISRYDVSEKLVIYDSPGVMWPKVDSGHTGLLLAVHNAIGINAYNSEEATIFLVECLSHFYPGVLANRYQIDEIPTDPVLFIETLGEKKGIRSKGGSVDFLRVSELVLTDYRRGRFGKVTLQEIDDLKK